MIQDVKGIKRFIYGYSKIPDKDGEYPFAIKYPLLPVPLST